MNKLRKLAETFGSVFLAAGIYVLHWEGCCIFFFGEYPFPEE